MPETEFWRLARAEVLAYQARFPELAERWSNITTLDLSLVQREIERIVGRVTLAIRFMALFSLGTGTLAAYGKPGDTFRFYELDPQVLTVAQRDFHYLSDSRARIESALNKA